MHLLLTSSDDVEKIAAAVGYADGVTLRNLLRRKLGRRRARDSLGASRRGTDNVTRPPHGFLRELWAALRRFRMHECGDAARSAAHRARPRSRDDFIARRLARRFKDHVRVLPVRRTHSRRTAGRDVELPLQIAALDAPNGRGSGPTAKPRSPPEAGVDRAQVRVAGPFAMRLERSPLCPPVARSIASTARTSPFSARTVAPIVSARSRIAPS